MASEAKSDPSISFVMANNPFILVFRCFFWLLLPSFELSKKIKKKKKKKRTYSS